MSLSLTFKIVLSSDYHIGTGYGLPSGADSALLRDVDGVPIIRGTTISGLLRDGLWRLLELPPLNHYRRCKASGLAKEKNVTFSYCGERSNTSYPCPICRLFGSPIHAKHWQIGSARSAGISTFLYEDLQKTGIAGQMNQRVRVNPVTRRAEPRKLFSQEDGDKRLCFLFTATCESIDESAWDEAALLVASARYIRELGRSRRRGQGQCLISLIATEPATLPGITLETETTMQATLLERFQQRWLESMAADTSIRETKPYSLIDNLASEPDEHRTRTPLRIRLVLRTDEPALIAHSAGGNQFNSIDYISGQVVLGSLANLVARRYGIQGEKWRKNPTYQDFVRLFTSEVIKFPVLYLAYKSDDLFPAVPAPLNLLTCKTFPAFQEEKDDHGIVSVQDDALAHTCRCCEDNMAGIDGYLYYDPGDETWRRIKVRKRNELHIRIDSERGRVAPGDLFGYMALEAGQYFVGDLLCQSAQDWQWLQSLTGIKDGEIITLRIGKASRRGYGAVSVQFECIPDATDVWIGQTFDERVVRTGGTNEPLVLSLLTDAILPDQWGRNRMGFEQAVSHSDQKLKLATWLQSVLDMPIDVVTSFSKVRPIDGFNMQLGLPRFRDTALVAGSTIVFKLPDPPPDWAQRLEKLEWDGIGQRRHEGFGRVVVNHPVQFTAAMNSAVSYNDTRSSVLSHKLIDEQCAQSDWKKELKENTQRISQHCRTPRFAALARWLYAQAHEPIEQIITILENDPDPHHHEPPRFGKPDQVLIAALGGQDEYGTRHKDNFWYTQGNEGRTLVLQLLKSIRDKRQYQPAIPAAITLLAERVAEAASEEETQ